MTEENIIRLIEKDNWMMDILRLVESLDLPDWWIGAGFVRSKVWDHLHGYKTRTPLPDVDVIYFDPTDFNEKEENIDTTTREKEYEATLSKTFPSVKWGVTNQARMHHFHNTTPYKNSEEALSEWSETATCIGVSLKNNKLELIAPHGIEDLVSLVVRPIPNYTKKHKHDPSAFERRVREKQWLKKWPKLKIKTSAL